MADVGEVERWKIHLLSATAKANNSEVHLERLEEARARCLERSFSFRQISGAEPGLLEFQGGDIPWDLSLILGDLVHSLRSALDHLACAIAAQSGSTVKSVQFPECLRSAGLSRRAIKSRLRSASDQHVEIIRKHIPTAHRSISLVQAISNQDKHRLILQSAATPLRANVLIKDGVGHLVEADEPFEGRVHRFLRNGSFVAMQGAAGITVELVALLDDEKLVFRLREMQSVRDSICSFVQHVSLDLTNL